MIKFRTYYGDDIFIVPERVLFVRDGGCGSRGVSAEVHLDNGKSVSLGAYAADVSEQIAEALRK